MQPRIHISVAFGDVAVRIVFAVAVGIVQRERPRQFVEVGNRLRTFFVELVFVADLIGDFALARNHAVGHENIVDFIVEIFDPVAADVQRFFVAPLHGNKPTLSVCVGKI